MRPTAAIGYIIDTEQESSGNELVAFHHVINSIYPKQVSKKVRQVKRVSARQGKFMNSLAPYGFRKSPEDKHVLIEDEEAARIVRRIFNEYAAGSSARAIGERMTIEGVDTPRFYHYAKMGRVNPFEKQTNTWGSATVLKLLRNQAHIGNMVQGKRQVISIKTKKVRCLDPENWIIVEKTHEPIVSQELWDRVHIRLTGKNIVRKTKNDKAVGLFAGILRYADCGSALAYMRKPLKNGEKGVYRCSRYNNNGIKACTTHYIDEADICAFVLTDIQRYAVLAVNERERLANRLMTSMHQSQSNEASGLRTKIRETENRSIFIGATLKSMYEDKVMGKIPKSVFQNMMKDYTVEQAELEERLLRLKRELDSIQEASKEIESWLELIEVHMNLEILDRATVTGLIERITVSERVKVNGKQT